MMRKSISGLYFMKEKKKTKKIIFILANLSRGGGGKREGRTLKRMFSTHPLFISKAEKKGGIKETALSNIATSQFEAVRGKKRKKGKE